MENSDFSQVRRHLFRGGGQQYLKTLSAVLFCFLHFEEGGSYFPVSGAIFPRGSHDVMDCSVAAGTVSEVCGGDPAQVRHKVLKWSIRARLERKLVLEVGF